MRVVLDCPTPSRPVDRHRFVVRGWVWLGERQSAIAAVEAWGGERMLGQSESLSLRPDVCQALSLPAAANTGFAFFADCPNGARGPLELHLRLRFSDGTRSDPLSPVRVEIADAEHAPVAAPESESDGTPTAQTPGAIAPHPPLLPPEHLQTRQVAGVWGPLFYTSGEAILEQIAALFRSAGRPLEDAAAILDFGCGCGRVLWNLQRLPHRAEVWGCDIDREAIAWNREHLAALARFDANPMMPPTRFRNGQFDAVYSVSVFTHLPEELQFAWLTELRRLVRPGGIVVASVHGAHYWKNSDAGVRAEVESRGFAYRTGEPTDGLPDFYMAAFHSAAYIRSRWSWFFEVVAIEEKAIHGVHDAVVLRRRDDIG